MGAGESGSAAAHLAERASVTPADERGRDARFSCAAGDEVALRLGWSRFAGARLVRDGLALATTLQPLDEALRRGDLDMARARPLLDRLWDQAPGLALAVQEQVLPDAPGRTPTQLARDVEAAILVADPESAELRHHAAVVRRRVDAPRSLPDGMAALRAILPAHAAAMVHATLDASARGARSGGDPRTLDQLRADALVGVVLGPADLATDLVDDLVEDREVPPDHADAVRGAAAVREADSVHRNGAAPGDDRVRRANAVPARGADAALGAEAGTGPRVRMRRPRTQVNVTVSLTTLLGLDEAPGHLDGHGPISAAHARMLALEGPWRRIVLDPLDNTVLDVGRTRYRPPAAIADHVRARDTTCVWPGCVVPAESADLDHTVEAHEGGTTSVANLAPLCRHHHRLKGEQGFDLAQPYPGVFVLLTPTGQRLLRLPGGVVRRLARWSHGRRSGGVDGVVVAPPRDLASASRAPESDRPPPF